MESSLGSSKVDSFNCNGVNREEDNCLVDNKDIIIDPTTNPLNNDIIFSLSYVT